MVHISNSFKEGECGYCGNNFEKEETKSEWDEKDEQNHHYKSVSCGKCKKENWLKVDFAGSGHDSRIDEESIESLIRKVQEGEK